MSKNDINSSFLSVIKPFIIASLCCFSLSGYSNNEIVIKENRIDKVAVADRNDQFVLPVIPDSIVSVAEGRDYLVMHYWDNFDFTDTSYIHQPNITEQAFVDFVKLLPQSANSSNSIELLLSRANKGDRTGRMYQYFTDLFEKYLYEPNSPFRNEELYTIVLQYIISSTDKTDLDKERAQFALDVVLKNRAGTQAPDILYTLPSGEVDSLYSVNSDYTILMFYNPDCNACQYTKDFIESSKILNKAIKSNRLKIVAVYPDQDLDTWRKYADTMPSQWINGYDHLQQVYGARIYELRAIPSLYLLDGNKMVILKDKYIETIEEYMGDNL